MGRSTILHDYNVIDTYNIIVSVQQANNSIYYIYIYLWQLQAPLRWRFCWSLSINHAVLWLMTLHNPTTITLVKLLTSWCYIHTPFNTCLNPDWWICKLSPFTNKQWSTAEARPLVVLCLFIVIAPVTRTCHASLGLTYSHRYNCEHHSHHPWLCAIGCNDHRVRDVRSIVSGSTDIEVQVAI